MVDDHAKNKYDSETHGDVSKTMAIPNVAAIAIALKQDPRTGATVDELEIRNGARNMWCSRRRRDNSTPRANLGFWWQRASIRDLYKCMSID